MGSNEAGEPERFTVERDGFHGFLHRPERDRFPGKALIVVGGSEGDEAIPLDLGRMFAQAGIATLGLCYWNVPGLPASSAWPCTAFRRAASSPCSRHRSSPTSPASWRFPRSTM